MPMCGPILLTGFIWRLQLQYELKRIQFKGIEKEVSVYNESSRLISVLIPPNLGINNTSR